MALFVVLALLVNLTVIQGKTGPEEALRAADAHFDVYASAIAKAHYNPWFCNYFREPGYKCTSCNTALHCFPGNFALLIQCSGNRPYCSNGYCSPARGEKCLKEESTDRITTTATPAEKPAERPVEKPTERPVEKPADNPEAGRLF